METNRSWSIDDRRYHFQFSTEIGWEIKGGKKTRMIKNPSYSGITTEFWNSSTQSARAIIRLCGRQIAAKDSPCKRWVPGTGPHRRASTM